MMNSSHGSLENIILNAVWNTEEHMENPISVAEVQGKINNINDQSWAYTTVKTVLDRLVDKGLIDRIKNGKKYFYKSMVSRDELGKKSIKKLAKQYYNNDIRTLLRAVETVLKEEKETLLV